MTDPLLTARDLGGQLGVSSETVLRWVRRGELPAVRLPSGAIRFRESELETWLTERATPGREAPTPQTGAAAAGAYLPTLRSSSPTLSPWTTAATTDEES